MSAFLVLGAIALSRRNQLSLSDPLIVVAAKAGGASELLSEDLQSGQIIEGLRVVNPFRGRTGHSPRMDLEAPARA